MHYCINPKRDSLKYVVCFGQMLAGRHHLLATSPGWAGANWPPLEECWVRQEQTWTDRNRLEQTETDRNRLEQTEINRNRHEQTGPDRNRQEQTGTEPLNQGSFCHVNLWPNRFFQINFRFFKLNFCFLSKFFKNI